MSLARVAKMTAAMVGILAVVFVGLSIREQSVQKDLARVKAEADAEQREDAHRRDVADQEKRGAAQRKAAADQAAKLAEREGTRARLATMDPGGRETAMRACAGGTAVECSEDDIADATANDAERARLRTVAEQVHARAGEDRRTKYANQYDAALLVKHLNPDGVTATGSGKTTLHVSGWFCSRQTLHDVLVGEVDREALAVGFKRFECENAMEVYSGDL